jgi:hypothetical protein
MNKIIATFNGNTPFKFFIEKAESFNPEDYNGEWVIYGCASSTNTDHDQEKMAPQALEQMAEIINKQPIPLRYEHQKDENSIIGKVFEASVDARNKLMIKAQLDKTNPIAKVLWDGIISGSKMGFSVGGRVVQAARELVEGIGKKIRTFYKVDVDEVSVTPRPSNFDAWMVNHSFAKSISEASTYRDNFSFYGAFLRDNPGLDYLAVIEKSIPDKDWIKVDSNIQNKKMKIIKTSRTSTETEETTPFVETTETDSYGKTSPDLMAEARKLMKINDEIYNKLGIKSEKDLDDNWDKYQQAVSSKVNGKISKEVMKYLLDNRYYAIVSALFHLNKIEKSQSQEDETSETTEEKENSTIDELITSDKSIPETSDTETTTKETSDTETTTKEEDEETVTSKSYVDEVVGNLKKELDSKFSDVLGVLKAIKKSIDTTDTTDETTEKDESETTSETEKDIDDESETTEKDETETTNETTKGFTTSTTEKDVDDETTSTTEKDVDDETTSTTSEAKKAFSRKSSSTESTTTKAEETISETFETTDSDTTDSDETTTSDTTDSTTNDYGAEYVIPDVNEAMKSARAMGINPLDAFVYALTKHIKQFENKIMEKNNTRIVGLANEVATIIRNDKTIQKSIKGWMNEPIAPKSVAFGVPYIKERNGDLFRLTPINKSEDEELRKSFVGKSFKELYQAKYSTTLE